MMIVWIAVSVAKDVKKKKLQKNSFFFILFVMKSYAAHEATQTDFTKNT